MSRRDADRPGDRRRSGERAAVDGATDAAGPVGEAAAVASAAPADGTAPGGAGAADGPADGPTDGAAGEGSGEDRDVDPAVLAAALAPLETYLLGEPPSLTRRQVAERAGVPSELAEELWRLLGFPTAGDDDVAFTAADVQALRWSSDLVRLGVLSPERQSALVRTWGRSYARLAEWQAALLADVTLESARAVGGEGGPGGRDPAETLAVLATEALERVEHLQSYMWRRHLATATSRLLAVDTTGAPGTQTSAMAVCFVDIVGYTSRSKSLGDAELVAWLEGFEAAVSDLVVQAGGRVIKNIGDEVLFVADDVAATVDVALAMAARGEDEHDDFPAVRAGVAHGDVVSRLGDVFGPTVNVASRLTSVARPGAVLVDRGAHDVLTGADRGESDGRDGDSDDGGDGTGPGPDERPDADGDADNDAGTRPAGTGPPGDGAAAYRFKRLRRVSVKGYSRLPAYVVRPR
ncbi:adenylate/guanylate cyclase domain-containing protein [Nocardioides sp. P86]|uniref:adenylate/guanylate cyclase domain-containing protein n=1 Tax=Nocardioides sp. P86 TaxID=2939569 RepID=UPI00203B0F1B|nr:adenylate/guanylate cyclase domain-containing protein [Nocardioides sp. P86]MCM3516549.1 adenylate/guanylate cyclase domain-containing protein [Nocardioides sp. P86]